MKELTKSQKRAREILLNSPASTAAEFAYLMWPNSSAIKRVYNVGNGATRGAGLWLCGGSYLAKLRMKGLVYRELDEAGRGWFWSWKSKKGI